MLMNNLRNFPPDTLGIFQSTLLQEELHKFSKLSNITLRFQSTLLQEERRWTFARWKDDKDFNPRSYKRSDMRKSWRIDFYSVISIHAPTRGATAGIYCLGTVFCISIHAPTRGATPDVRLILPLDDISIHAPTRGATVTLW